MTSNISIINLIKCKIELNDGDNKRLLARVSEKKISSLVHYEIRRQAMDLTNQPIFTVLCSQ